MTRILFVCYPDSNHPIGGVKQIYRQVSLLCASGINAFVLHKQDGFRVDWFTSDAPVLSLRSFLTSHPDPVNDVFVIPETWVGMLPNYFLGFKKIIFNQNASYTFGLPSKTIYKPSAITAIYHHQDILQVWCVSRSDYNFLIRGLDLPISNVHRVINAIDFELEPIQSFQKKHQI